MALSRPRWHLVQDRLEPTSKGVLEKLVILETYCAGSGLKLPLTFIALSLCGGDHRRPHLHGGTQAAPLCNVS